jgi:hypothetical protein
VSIPTVFRRDATGFCTSVPWEDTAWVVEGEGVARRLYDGIPVRFDGRDWHAWQAPLGWVLVKHKGEIARMIGRALGLSMYPRMGTYELCGPGIHLNPEGFKGQVLIWHREAERIKDLPSRDLYDIADWFAAHYGKYSGIVFHHHDGIRLAKIKPKDIRPNS